MRRARPGAPPRGTSERALTSVGAGADFDDGGNGGHQNGEHGGTPDGARAQGGPAGQNGQETRTGPRRPEAEPSRLWYITLSVSGAEAPLPEVRRGLEQLAHDHPFLLTSRYAGDHAEIRYWEEARDLHDAAAVALRLWGEHRSTAQLPAWEIVGLEVIDRDTYHQRVAEGYGPPPAAPVGVHPY
ncbi:hypothetical protein [Streptomyces sp. NPDC051561]|uniref:hypothetical protein n=1 Tax=Streptomyces sp. NPDC051561 TaxID=3365658 RepID=UPI0037B76FD0